MVLFMRQQLCSSPNQFFEEVLTSQIEEPPEKKWSTSIVARVSRAFGLVLRVLRPFGYWSGRVFMCVEVSTYMTEVERNA